MKLMHLTSHSEALVYQISDDGELHPVAFHSQKFEAAEINNEIHDKELLAIVDSFQQWCQFLKGSSQQIIVYNDHKNLILSKCSSLES